MEINAIGIEEVVAVEYDVLKKKDLTGSSGSVNANEIAIIPILLLKNYTLFTNQKTINPVPDYRIMIILF